MFQDVLNYFGENDIIETNRMESQKKQSCEASSDLLGDQWPICDFPAVSETKKTYHRLDL